MNMKEIRHRAKEAGVTAGRKRKAELIRSLQRSEGNVDCFGNFRHLDCWQFGCCWRSDCLTEKPDERREKVSDNTGRSENLEA